MTESVAYCERIGIHMGRAAVGFVGVRKRLTSRSLRSATLYDKAGGDE